MIVGGLSVGLQVLAYGGLSVERKDRLKGWSSGYPGGRGEVEVYVIGGPNGGMSGLYGAEQKEKLGTRCRLLNSRDVIEQLKY